jgi:AraC-like DNA-binding protein
MKFHVLLLFICLWATKSLYAQDYTPLQDSLIQLLESEQNNNQRLNTYFELVDDFYVDGWEKEGDAFFKKMETFIQQNNIQSGEGFLSVLKGYKAFFIKNDIPNAIVYTLEGAEEMKKVVETSFSRIDYLITALDELGYFYENAGMYDKALEIHLEALEFAKKYKDRNNEMRVYNSLFFLNSEYFNDNELGIEYLKKALKIAEEIDDSYFKGVANGNLAMLYISMDDYKNGDFFLEKAIFIKEELKDTIGLAHIYLEKARLFYQKRDLKKAQLYIGKSLGFVSQGCNWCYQIQITKGQIAKAEGNYKEAEKSFLLAQELVDAAPVLSQRYSILIHLAMLAKDRNEVKKAANYYAEAFIVKEDLDKKWTLGNVMKIKIQSKVAKIEAEKKNLIVEKELLGAKFKLQQRITFLSILLLCLAVGSMVFIFLQKNKLSEAYHILVQKNQALTLSVLKKEAKGIEKVEKVEKIPEAVKDKKTVLSELEIALLKKIEKALEVDKVFLESTLSLASFAQLLDTNTTYLSKTINSHYNKRFSVLINESRIKEILLYFESDRLKDFTIFALAQEAGFNSKSAFNKAFKEYTGVTPTFYLKSINENRKFK